MMQKDPQHMLALILEEIARAFQSKPEASDPVCSRR